MTSGRLGFADSSKHCIMEWIKQDSSKGQCPMCRQSESEWLPPFPGRYTDQIFRVRMGPGRTTTSTRRRATRACRRGVSRSYINTIHVKGMWYQSTLCTAGSLSHRKASLCAMWHASQHLEDFIWSSTLGTALVAHARMTHVGDGDAQSRFL